MKAIQFVKWFVVTCLSDSGQVSFGRTISTLIVLYFLAQDAWFFHRAGHLVENSMLLTQLTVMTAFYGVSKGLAVAGGTKPELKDGQ